MSDQSASVWYVGDPWVIEDTFLDPKTGNPLTVASAQVEITRPDGTTTVLAMSLVEGSSWVATLPELTAPQEWKAKIVTSNPKSVAKRRIVVKP